MPQLRTGKIELKQVKATGDITTNTSFGDTDFQNGSGNTLSVETNSGAVSLTKLTVKKEIKVQDQFGEIDLCILRNHHPDIRCRKLYFA